MNLNQANSHTWVKTMKKIVILAANPKETIRLRLDQEVRDIEEEFTGHTKDVWIVVFSPKGQVLVTGGAGATPRLWNLRGQPITTFAGASDSGNTRALSFSPNGQQLDQDVALPD